MTQMRLRRHLGWAAAMGLTALVLTGTSAGPAIAQGARPILTLVVNGEDNPVPVRAAGLTDVRRPASELVELAWGNVTVPAVRCFVRLLPTYEPESNCYTPPSGRSLVITDVIWYAPETGESPGSLGGIDLTVIGKVVAFTGTAVVSSTGSAGGEHHLQTGFLFHPDLISTQLHVRLFGYLTPSE